MNHAITAKNLCLWYGSTQALKNINIQIPENNITALIGPSGLTVPSFQIKALFPAIKKCDYLNSLYV